MIFIILAAIAFIVVAILAAIAVAITRKKGEPKE